MFSVMLIDDELIVRSSLNNFIDWHALGCEVVCEASNGIEARNILEARPIDIIIADIKMPGLTGIELAEYVSIHHKATKVILLTGFADFTYAQSAIQYGVVDFVIKTNPIQKIKDAVRKAIDLIVEQQEKHEKIKHLEDYATEKREELKEKFIHDMLIKAYSDPDAASSKAEELGIRLDHYFVLAVEIEKTSEELESELENEEEHFRLLLRNFLLRTFKDYNPYTVFMDYHLLCVVISMEHDDYSESIRSITTICEEILSTMSHYMSFSVSIGISNRQDDLLKLSVAYHEACSALSKRFFTDCKVSFYLSDETSVFLQGTTNIHTHMEELFAYIQASDMSKAKQKLHDIFNSHRAGKPSVQHMRPIAIILFTLLSNMLAKYNHYQTYSVEHSFETYTKILRSKSIHEIYDLFFDLLQSIANSLNAYQATNNVFVEKVLQYIETNYQQEITLSGIADYVHLNNSYLSRLFKKETGKNISEAITMYRIQKAKELLKNARYKIYEVGGMVGMPDSAHFSNVFKKYAGLSPKEFKDAHQLSKNGA